jgi:glycosyltransferase involved in cell wall biosynthesis
MTEAVSQGRPTTELPNWALVELHELAAIEPQLFPSPEFVSHYRYHDIPVAREVGDLYASCFERLCGFTSDLIILVPWLVPGGADQGVLHHVEAAVSEGRGVLVITTLDSESPWKERIAVGARVLELGRLGAHLSEDQRLVVLTRLLLQLQAPVVHIINSQLGWEMVKRHGKSLIAVGKRVYASLYCEDVDIYGKRWGYALSYLTDCWPYLRAVICDSAWYPKCLVARYGCAQEKFFTLYFPVLVDIAPVYSSATRHRILWAGRLTAQKRPDLLAQIATRLPDIAFDVHGYAANDTDRAYEAKLSELPNVTLHGSFHSLRSVVAENTYSLLLYTSAWDGLPITLLDATIAGLPVVASAVGGVAEFITEETGYPVWEADEPSGYVERIREALADDLSRRRKWEAALGLVQGRHQVDQFCSGLRSIPGYFSSSAS